jgi:hypothetical protein
MVYRVDLLNSAYDEIREGRWWLPKDAGTIDGGEFYAQLKAPSRVRDLTSGELMCLLDFRLRLRIGLATHTRTCSRTWAGRSGLGWRGRRQRRIEKTSREATDRNFQRRFEV